MTRFDILEFVIGFLVAFYIGGLLGRLFAWLHTRNKTWTYNKDKKRFELTKKL